MVKKVKIPEWNNYNISLRDFFIAINLEIEI